ncbi:MAG: segregation/condensation protein A [Clostridia bacterium]|nr:segregation/condensation protein A [Clostridia bacterium]
MSDTQVENEITAESENDVEEITADETSVENNVSAEVENAGDDIVAKDEKDDNSAQATDTQKSEEVVRKAEILPVEPNSLDELFSVHTKYVYHIKNFDGPIEMLSEMLHDRKIDIDDIFISDITHQYVEIIKNTPKEELDYEYAGEFITMAATLVYQKSLRALPQDDDEEITPDDPRYEGELLIRMLKEYEIMKEQSEKLREVEIVNSFSREPVYTDKDYRLCIVDFSMTKLVEAFAHVLANFEQNKVNKIPKKVFKDRFSVSDQMKHIVGLLDMYETFSFKFLIEPSFERGDIVITFLAVLELMKFGKIRAEQDESFGDIVLSKVADADSTLKLEELDEQY